MNNPRYQSTQHVIILAAKVIFIAKIAISKTMLLKNIPEVISSGDKNL